MKNEAIENFSVLFSNMNNLQKLGSLGLIYAKRLGSKGLHRSSYRMFSLLTETQKNDMTHQMFTVGVDNGFLPRQDPLVELPEEFGRLESLLQRMPMQLLDGTPGLLASGQFGDAVRDELPLYDVDKITDQRLLSGK